MSHCDSIVDATGCRSEGYFLNGFKIKAIIKVTAEFFLFSPFSLPSIKIKIKKITGNTELGLETIPHPCSRTSPMLLLYQEYLVSLPGPLGRPGNVIYGWKYNGMN